MTQTQTAMTSDAVSTRDVVIGAITAGHHTAREIANSSGLNLSTIITEAEVLAGLYVTILPGPPCVSYWLKGNEPKGKLIRQEGKLVEMPVEEVDEDFTDIISAGNKQIAESHVIAAEYDLSQYEPAADAESILIPMELVIVHPLNIRGQIDTQEPEFINLTNSIREVGVQQPVVVTPHDNTGLFRVVMGNRRRLASEAAGCAKLPCIVRHYDSPETEIAVMLIENIQRQGLKPMAEARAFKTLFVQSNKDLDAVARQTGLTQAYIYTRLRLLKLAQPIQEMIDRREISPASGAAVAALDSEQQTKIVPRLSKMKLGEVKKLVNRIKNGNVGKTPVFHTPKQLRETTDDERFTRTGAIKSLTDIGDAWFTATNIRKAFDDVCLDACVESKNETICHSCPVPRFITSILRRTKKETA